MVEISKIRKMELHEVIAKLEEMDKDIKIPPAPTVYCPKDKEKVPIYFCLGSLTQGRELCPYLVKATVYGGEHAEVECKWKPEPPLYRRGRRRITKLTEGV